MNRTVLENAQMLQEHPIKKEKESYRIQYIRLLEYYVNKYAKNDVWAEAALKLYKVKLLDKPENYTYSCGDIQKQSDRVFVTKFRKFKFFSYRFTLLIDCIFICAVHDREKSDTIFSELKTFYNSK